MNKATILLGRKAENLLILKQKFADSVPDFIPVPLSIFLVDWDVQREIIIQLAQQYLAQKLRKSAYEKQLKNRIDSLIPSERYIQQLLESLSERKFTIVSYRTSATFEDLAKTSFAGQYLTLLNKTCDTQTLVSCIRKCTQSLFASHVLDYLKINQQEIKDQGGSIVIQKMYFGEYSGVLFSENGKAEIMISYSKSWKNMVVTGEKSPTFTVNKHIIDKKFIPRELLPSILEIIKKSLLLESEEKKSLDIEWALSKKSIALLQMRPITTTSTEYSIEWDCTNIAESYPGVTLPLTYSFIQKLYAKVYPEFLNLLGKKESQLSERQHVFNNMLGYLNGHVFYNINNWYELIALLPGYSYNKQFFEAMLMPVKNKQETKKPSKKSISAAIILLYSGLRFMFLLLSTDILSRKFITNYHKQYNRYTSILWQELQADVILQKFTQIEKTLLKAWAVPILNDFRTMVFHGLLKKLYFNTANNEKYLKLLSGIYDQTSLEPIHKLETLVTEIKEQLDKHKGNEKKLKKAIEQQENLLHVREKIITYIRIYGGRSPDELKLENPRLGESFSDFLSFLIVSAKNFSTKNKPEIPIEQIKEKIITQVIIKRPLVQRIVLRSFLPLILYQVKSGISKRERFRFYRAQVFNLARTAYLALGCRFTEAGLLKLPADIFYLTHEELVSLVYGHAFDFSVSKRVEERKKLFAQYTTEHMGRRITATGIIAPLNKEKEIKLEGKKLHGLGVAKGIYKGPVAIMKKFDPEMNIKGKILVTPHIDPGWTLLFINASGIIVEKGNALSHASIVAREIGIPAIVAVDGACDRLVNEQEIAINGITGEITII